MAKTMEQQASVHRQQMQEREVSAISVGERAFPHTALVPETKPKSNPCPSSSRAVRQISTLLPQPSMPASLQSARLNLSVSEVQTRGSHAGVGGQKRS